MPNAPATHADPLVERVETAVYTVPTDAPEGDGTLAWSSTTLVLARVHSGATAGIGFTYGAAATAQVIEEVLADQVSGKPAWDVPTAHEAMHRAVRNAGRPGLVAGALSAVDIALWDLKARLAGLSMGELLGRCWQQVPVYGSGGFTPYTARRQESQLREWVEERDIPRVKIKIGENWGQEEHRDLERVARARESIGDAELYVDANGAYSAKQAIRLAPRLADRGVTWFEEPVSSDDLAGLARVRRAVTTDVAAGEYGYTLPYFWHMISSGAVDCLQADVTRCGGITGWLRAAASAHAANLQISGHCAPHLHAHAAASVPNVRHLEWFHDHVRIEQLLFEGTLDPHGGVVCPGASDAPGLGLALRADVADRYRTG
ncbi:mandelate racemase [Streptomyces qinglanensis]|uniref:Mandelate racemase n=1 Tax=Streptomyces qinglanensis TaxID=943816 RepID=A0A1E7K716_9ACTN|nr:enolase C-terminal domain-like protein [Streptomyces qinglanensis]OEU99729.1 mandelate racemase [Streptomyces qinglanensis]OEV24151.1 mandelate racemase [Streptomyces nanshensis]